MEIEGCQRCGNSRKDELGHEIRCSCSELSDTLCSKSVLGLGGEPQRYATPEEEKKMQAYLESLTNREYAAHLRKERKADQKLATEKARQRLKAQIQ